MEGECIITLTGSEIEMVLAKALKIDPKQVKLSAGHKVVGCGPMEREEHHVIAKISMQFQPEVDKIQFGTMDVPSI